MKSIVLATLIGICLPLISSAETTADELLLRSYIRYTLATEVHSQARKLAAEAKGAQAEQISSLADEWFGEEVDSLRADLEKRFGDNARERFSAFVAEFTAAEKSGDSGYLEQLSRQAGLMEPPSDYKALRRLALERWLKDQFAVGTSLLSEIQTWSELAAKQSDAPTLDAWLERNQAQAAPAPKQVKRPANPLRAAEAKAPAWDDSVVSASGSALDSFAKRRKDRREQAMQTAQAGMQQMSVERQAAEQERAARIAADAQAEAEAMRAHAQKLAAVEAEALKQRENSWGNRIKRIVGSTIGAGVGAFTGGIGTEAGRRAADAVFN